MPRQGTKGDAMASRGRKEGGGMVAAVLFVLRCAIESPKFHRSFGSYWQFLHIRNDGRNGLVATELRQILERMVQGEEKRKNYPTKKYNCPHRSKKKPERSTNAMPRALPCVEGRVTFALKEHKFPNDVFALTGRSLHRLLPMAMPCADCLMPLRGVIA